MTSDTTSIPVNPRAPRPLAWTAFACALIVALGIAAYANTFNCPFIFDDTFFVDAPSAQHLWPIGPILASSRPVVQLTFALNYALGGPGVTGYHIVNLAIHLLAALALFGIVRRTLRMPRLAGRFTENSAVALAFCAALLWTLHPLQTEAVTYVVQRMESLMGLFYLLTLYCLIRSALSPRPAGWAVASILSFALGTGCKEVIVTAPAMLFLYDRIFIAGSFRETLRRRWPFYAALLATTGLLLARSVLQAFDKNTLSAGFRLESVSPLQYAQTQPGVILHYLRLAFWPSGLCVDYGWPIATNAWEILPAAAVLAALLAAAVWALVRKPKWGFLGAWFFLILAPTSSILPIKDLAFEHRMYLPLAAVVALAAIAAYSLIRRLARSDQSATIIAIALSLSASAVLGAVTFSRNADYRSAISMWTDVTREEPRNSRAWSSLGEAYANAGQPRYDEAIRCCDEALALDPKSFEAHYNLASVYNRLGRYDDAIRSYGEALAISPKSFTTCNSRALLYAHLRRYDDALHDYDQAIAINPEYAPAYYNRGNALADMGRAADALCDYNKALKLNPRFSQAYIGRGNICARDGRLAEAILDFSRAIELNPDDALARNDRGAAYARSGRPDEAIRDFTDAVRLDPNYFDAYANRGKAYAQIGRAIEAVADYDKAIALNADFADAYYNRAAANVRLGRLEQAISDYSRVLALNPGNAAACYNCANALSDAGRRAEAVRDYDQAIALKPDFAAAYNNRAVTHYEMKAYDKAWADVKRFERLGGRPDPAFLKALTQVCPEPQGAEAGK